MIVDPTDHPHRRHNVLADQWVLVSPHRARRPWQGQEDAPETAPRIPHDPDCYLCPGNIRVTGAANPAYRAPYVFANDFAALTPDAPAPDSADPLFHIAGARLTHGPRKRRSWANIMPMSRFLRIKGA